MARGDHIKVRRWGGVYSHHGIDMGDGTVIHFAGEPFHARKARVCRTEMSEFLDGGVAELVSYPANARSAEETAAAAEALLDRQGYCMWRNNCEHFASFCRTGRPYSRQVARAIRLSGMAAGAACSAAWLVVSARRRSFATSRDAG